MCRSVDKPVDLGWPSFAVLLLPASLGVPLGTFLPRAMASLIDSLVAIEAVLSLTPELPKSLPFIALLSVAGVVLALLIAWATIRCGRRDRDDLIRL